MAGVLWYFPGAQGSDPVAWFRAAGLGDLVVEGDVRPMGMTSPVTCGPDGGVGHLGYWEDDPPIAQTVDLDRQTWMRAPQRGDLPSGRFWVGQWNDRPATPDCLRRRNAPFGQAVQLGRWEWLVPLARELPKVMGLADDGTIGWRIESAVHRTYDDRARELVQQMRSTMQGGRFSYDLEQHAQFAAQALQIGYRVSVEALVLMGAIRSDDVWQAAWIAAGMPVDEFDAKKNEVGTDVGG